MSAQGAGAVEGGPWIHPEHRLKRTERPNPFYCFACKEIGFWCSYSCERCAVHVHKACMSPPIDKPHPLGLLLFVRSFTAADGKFCGACSKQLGGCGYKSIDGKSSFHPCCLHLEKIIKVNDEEIMLKMENVSLRCKWCKKVSIRVDGAVIPSWFYVSMGKDGCFHVGCIQEMMRESWKVGRLDQPVRGKEEGDNTSFATYLSIKIKIPIDPSEIATEKLADGIAEAAATGDKSKIRKLIKDFWGGRGSGAVWENTKHLWQLLLAKVGEGIASLADTPIGRAARKVWSTVTEPSKLWDLVRPLLHWASSKLRELAKRMIAMPTPQRYLPYDAQAV
ncbi:uncharacterized protein LOC120291185 [Eucalyptus grandis]|uniref:uncharacterized protein LOC120291185 n=1 Tax=Eucalyptus grandis TaxID=71139 RepID=UPI00192EEDD3|nr:uncharacterized protein LOC120291185 [Eucalyptus grandis]